MDSQIYFLEVIQRYAVLVAALVPHNDKVLVLTPILVKKKKRKFPVLLTKIPCMYEKIYALDVQIDIYLNK